MNAILSVVKGFIFDKGSKVLAGAGAAALLFDVISKFLETGESAKICLELGQGGALLLLAGLAVLIAFKSEPPKRKNEYE